MEYSYSFGNAIGYDSFKITSEFTNTPLESQR